MSTNLDSYPGLADAVIEELKEAQFENGKNIDENFENIVRECIDNRNEKSVARVPVEDIIIDLGITLEQANLDLEISGFIKIQDNENLICVNRKHYAARKFFTIAHELGHFVLHKNHIKKQSDNKLLDGTMYRRSCKDMDDKEKEANQFAAIILMPKTIFRNEYNKCMDKNIEPVAHLATIFDVSEAAIAVRAGFLGLTFLG